MSNWLVDEMIEEITKDMDFHPVWDCHEAMMNDGKINRNNTIPLRRLEYYIRLCEKKYGEPVE